MERMWLNAYPGRVRVEIDADAFGSTGEFFAASVERVRYRTAFVGMGRTISFDELDRLSGAFASYLVNVARVARGFVRNGGTLMEIELVAHCRQYLIGYKTSRRIEFRDTLPRSTIGKMPRHELQDNGRFGGE